MKTPEGRDNQLISLFLILAGLTLLLVLVLRVVISSPDTATDILEMATK